MKQRYLLDTGPAFDCLFRRRGVDRRVEQARSRGAKVGICLPVLGEIIAGLEGSDSRATAWVIAHRTLGTFIHWPFDKRAAYEFGRLFVELKRIGRPMQQIDIQVAAIAFSLGNCTVGSADSDLASVPGLKVENWSS